MGSGVDNGVGVGRIRIGKDVSLGVGKVGSLCGGFVKRKVDFGEGLVDLNTEGAAVGQQLIGS